MELNCLSAICFIKLSHDQTGHYMGLPVSFDPLLKKKFGEGANFELEDNKNEKGKTASPSLPPCPSTQDSGLSR